MIFEKYKFLQKSVCRKTKESHFSNCWLLKLSFFFLYFLKYLQSICFHFWSQMKIQCTMLCEFLSFFSAMQIKYVNGMSSSHEIYLYIKSKEHVMSIGRTKKSPENHLRIFVWHLLMNLKNNYLLKNFWSGSIKNVRILIFTIMYFLKKNKEKHLEIYFTSVYKKSWLYDLQFLRYRVWQTEIDN